MQPDELTYVNGQTVVLRHPVETPLSRPDRPMYYKRIVRFELVDGTSVYACTECDYTHPNVYAARGHVNATHPIAPRRPYGTGRRATATRDSESPADWASLTLGEAAAMVRRFARLTAERDEWKERAIAAERTLSAIRRSMP